MDGFPPTAEEDQALHFFYGADNQTREDETREVRKTHDRDKRKGYRISIIKPEGTGRSEDLGLEARKILKLIIKI